MTPAPTSPSLYLDQLSALATLGMPLATVPDGVPATIELRGALRDLEIGLLKVQIAIMKERLTETIDR